MNRRDLLRVVGYSAIPFSIGAYGWTTFEPVRGRVVSKSVTASDGEGGRWEILVVTSNSVRVSERLRSLFNDAQEEYEESQNESEDADGGGENGTGAGGDDGEGGGEDDGAQTEEPTLDTGSVVIGRAVNKIHDEFDDVKYYVEFASLTDENPTAEDIERGEGDVRETYVTVFDRVQVGNYAAFQETVWPPGLLDSVSCVANEAEQLKDHCSSSPDDDGGIPL